MIGYTEGKVVQSISIDDDMEKERKIDPSPTFNWNYF